MAATKEDSKPRPTKSDPRQTDAAPPQTDAAPGPPDAEPDPLETKLKSLPTSPGCYIFRDKRGDVLYVGKAKSLRARVRSYFQAGASDTRAFIPFLRRMVRDLDTIVAGTEKEAAILENSLIKENKPRFNVKLRDDKEFLTLRLRLEHEWPRLELVRRPTADKSRYFGPYHSATAARRTLHLVEKHFQLRTCSDRELGSRKRPCLQFQIKRCPAPCIYEVDAEVYAQQVQAVALFLDGRHDELTSELEERMRHAATNLEYELAATYRDQLDAVRSVREAQRVVAMSDRDQDVLGIYREGDLVEMAVLYVRSGRVVDAASFPSRGVEVPDDEVVAAFVRDHYSEGGPGARLIPDEVLVPLLPEGAEGVEEWLTDRRHELLREAGKTGRRCLLLAPARGPRRKLVDMAAENAQHAFAEKQRAIEDADERLAKLQQRLRLPTLPRRIECTDISHSSGKDTVGSVVALLDGLPDKKRYRTYHVQSVNDGDDYAAMYEVLSRRFLRGRTAKEGPETTRNDLDSNWDLPDLFVVDGGRGQLAVALTAARDLGLFDLSIVGLAKERETPLGDKLVDRVYLPNQKNPISLRPNSAELFFLARVRDEAHRFANRGRKKLGKRRTLGSTLDDVPGVGPKTRNALLTSLGTVERVRRASDEELLNAGLNRRQLASLRAHFAEPSHSKANSATTE